MSDLLCVKEAYEKIHSFKKRNFVESVDLAIKYKAEESVKLFLDCPHSFNKPEEILAFPDKNSFQKIKDLGVVLGDEELCHRIKDGKFNLKKIKFCVAHKDSMIYLQKIARNLSVKKLMPNAANGTLSVDVMASVSDFLNGKIMCKSSKGKTINLKLGNINFSLDELSNNVAYMLNYLLKSNIKVFKSIKSVALNTTMGPSMFLDWKSIVEKS